MPFKQFHDFAGARGGEHPGQPVHSDLHFDVWVSFSPSRPPLYYLITEDGHRIEFETPQKAIDHGRTMEAPTVNVSAPLARIDQTEPAIGHDHDALPDQLH
ncbi:MAG TPA: hypothetical protein VK797_22780 [Tepidisphaeraceae bacterium]|jgi:hypothetical protein|nr:hypothetical protein [Tepidisphaeraceae bacterium]